MGKKNNDKKNNKSKKNKDKNNKPDENKTIDNNPSKDNSDENKPLDDNPSENNSDEDKPTDDSQPEDDFNEKENKKPKINSLIFLFDIIENPPEDIPNEEDSEKDDLIDDPDYYDDPEYYNDPDYYDDPSCSDDPSCNDPSCNDPSCNDPSCKDPSCKDDPSFKDPKNNRKRNSNIFDNEPTNNLDFIFKKIINDINSKNKKKQKIEVKDDFKDYFKESDKLLTIDKEIKTLKDLIQLGESYDPSDKNRYVINLRALNKCVNHLRELDSMIGMKNIKEMIVDLIFFRLQNLEDTKDELWHLVIQGTPGSGKTEVAKIIGKLYYSLGIVKKDKFTLVKRSDLIGKYLGHTAKMTQEVFDNAKGGVIFIDEAYSLGNPEQRDSFSKECIDTINQNLTENKETVVFIAGYKEQLDESFFSYNPGLNRRFKMRMNVDKYNASDLREIFIKKINENKWGIFEDNKEREIPLAFFEKNIGLFKYNGGDMENLWHLTKIVHARRIFGKSYDIAKKITSKDLENALKIYCENDEVKNRNESISKYMMDSMYC
jgi:hypothetical protein